MGDRETRIDESEMAERNETDAEEIVIALTRGGRFAADRGLVSSAASADGEDGFPEDEPILAD